MSDIGRSAPDWGLDRSWADPVPVDVRLPSHRRALPLLLWVACLAASLGLLWLSGTGRLAAPPLTEPGTWGQWAAGRDPVEVVMVVGRLLGLALAWYLLGVTTVSLVAHAARAARLVRIADALSIGPVRVVVQHALGLGLATTVLATSTPAAVPTPEPATTAAEVESGVQHLAEPTPSPTTMTDSAPVPVPAPGTPDGSLTPEATRSPEAPATPEASPRPGAPRPTPTSVNVVVADATPESAPREVVVEAGDHFWSLAEEVVGATGAPVTEARVAAYWRALVTANRDRLVDTTNPDLLLPGQVLVLPPVEEDRA